MQRIDAEQYRAARRESSPIVLSPFPTLSIKKVASGDQTMCDMAENEQSFDCF